MWKNWIPFRKKHENERKRDTFIDLRTGKENESSIASHEDCGPLNNNSVSVSVKSTRGQCGLNQSSHLHSYENDTSYNASLSGLSSFANNRYIERKVDLDLSSNFDLDIAKTHTRNKRRMENHNHHNDSSSAFNTVHGPLLSTPIMPKVRRVIETKSGLRRYV